MASTLSRARVNQYSSAVSGGSVPSDLFMVHIDHVIDRIRDEHAPMIDLIGSSTQTKHVLLEYIEDDLPPQQDAVNNASGISTTATTVAVDNANYFQQYDLVKNRRTGEVVWLPDAPSTSSITVVRDWPDQSGTGTAMNDNDILDILGPAVPEGVDGPRSPISLGEKKQNTCQIIEYTWEMSNRGRHQPHYQVQTDHFKYHLKRFMDAAVLDLDSMLLNGLLNTGDGNGDNPSTFRGLRADTTTNVQDMSSNPLEFQDILTLLQTAHADVGTKALGKTIMGNHFVKRVWNSYYQLSRRAGIRDAKFRVTWDEVDTDFGTLKFVLNRKCEDDELFFWNPQDTKLKHFVNGKWSTGMYSTQGWYDRGFVRGDYGVIFQAERRRGRWHSFSTTESDYQFLDLPAVYAIPTAA